MSGNDARERREGSPGDAAEGDLSGRLHRLGAELEARRGAPQAGPARVVSASNASSMARAMRASTEFVAGVLVGGGLGWALDKALGTSPWGLIVFLLLGFAAGVYNVMRSAGLSPPTSTVARDRET